MKLLINKLAISLVLVLGLIGCGSNGGSSSSKTTTTDIEVERGKVYDANVTDSSTPQKVATMTVGSNIYTFTGTPTYPIVASGGWIDVDGDGNMTVADVVNDLNLTSYSKVITPVTTYLGDITSTAGKSRLAKLIADMNTTEADLLLVPSKSKKNAIVVQNAIYSIMIKKGTTNIDAFYSDINSSFVTLKTYVDSDPSKRSSSDIALFAEARTVLDLWTTGKITKLDSSKIAAIKTKRPSSGSIVIPLEGIITHNSITYGTVTSPYTNKVWLDRNLGANQVCTSFDDELCYGDYYQWGRNTDGHEKKDSLTADQIKVEDLNNSGNKFVIYVYDWTNQDSNGSIRSAYWSKTDGSSICPVGFRVPNMNELLAETVNEGVNNQTDAFNNFLKLPSAGARITGWGGSKTNYGRIWSSDISGTSSSENKYLYFNSTRAYVRYDYYRANGLSIRCIKN